MTVLAAARHLIVSYSLWTRAIARDLKGAKA